MLFDCYGPSGVVFCFLLCRRLFNVSCDVFLTSDPGLPFLIHLKPRQRISGIQMGSEGYGDLYDSPIKRHHQSNPNGSSEGSDSLLGVPLDERRRKTEVAAITGAFGSIFLAAILIFDFESLLFNYDYLRILTFDIKLQW